MARFHPRFINAPLDTRRHQASFRVCATRLSGTIWQQPLPLIRPLSFLRIRRSQVRILLARRKEPPYLRGFFAINGRCHLVWRAN